MLGQVLTNTRALLGNLLLALERVGLSCSVGVLSGTASDPNLCKKRSTQGHNATIVGTGTMQQAQINPDVRIVALRHTVELARGAGG